MKITTFGKYLTQLTRYTMINCYLLREDDGFTLIDTGMSGSEGQIMAAAQKLGAPIRRIVLTHAHIDHVGSLDALHALLPEADVMITARDARFLTGDKRLDPDEPQVPLKGGYPVCTTKPTRLLKDGDRVGSLEVVASPGHTPGHIAFLDQRDRSLIAGDAYTTKGGISTAGTMKLLFPLSAMATWHRETGLRSAERLLALKPSRLAVGHGIVLENPEAAMQSAIDEAKRQLEKLHAAQKAS